MAHRNPSRPLTGVKNQFRPITDWVGGISDVVVCPYDPSHKMKGHKLMAHLIKCEKQLKKAETDAKSPVILPEGFEKCPYNSLHRYRIGMQEEHFRVCKARAEELMTRLNSGQSLEGIDERYTSLKIADFEKPRDEVKSSD